MHSRPTHVFVTVWIFNWAGRLGRLMRLVGIGTHYAVDLQPRSLATALEWC